MASSERSQFQPLPPVLASTLLDVELERYTSSARSGPWLFGIQGIDNSLPRDVLSSGKVIALAMGPGCSSLADHIIATHLLSSSPGSEVNNRPSAAFLIVPHHGKIVSTLHQTLESRISSLPRDKTSLGTVDALQLLDQVQVLQYFDFAGLCESVSEVSTRLLEQHTTAIASGSRFAKVVVYIDGLSWAVESVQRRSGPVQANAVLASLLRSLTHLSCSRPSGLTFLSLDVREELRLSDELHSAFSNSTSQGMQLSPGGALGRTLEAGMDVIILLHNGHGIAERGQIVVEVIKDRMGGCLGAWAVRTVEQENA